jgi:hypothetical protein
LNARAQAHQLFEAQYLAALTPPRPQADRAWVDAVQTRLRVPHAAQRRFIESTAKRKVIRAGRRGGKTCGVALIALHGFLAGRRILYAVPTQEQVDRFWFEVKRALEPALDAGDVIKNETRHLVEVSGTQNRIRAKTAWDPDSLRGDYCDLLILDELQMMREDTLGLVGLPMLADNNGDCALIFTPPSFVQRARSQARDPLHANKLFRRAAADTSGRWESFHFTSHDNPYISQEALEDLAVDMTELAFRQEILAEDIEDNPGAIFKRAMIGYKALA